MTPALIAAAWLAASVIAGPIIGRALARAGCPCGTAHQ